MRIIAAGAALAAATLVGACHNSPADKLADRVESAADSRADTMETNADALRSQAAALDKRADQTRKTGDSRSDAIKAADQNVGKMSQQQRDAIVASQAPAVK